MIWWAMILYHTDNLHITSVSLLYWIALYLLLRNEHVHKQLVRINIPKVFKTKLCHLHQMVKHLCHSAFWCLRTVYYYCDHYDHTSCDATHVCMHLQHLVVGSIHCMIFLCHCPVFRTWGTSPGTLTLSPWISHYIPGISFAIFPLALLTSHFTFLCIFPAFLSIHIFSPQYFVISLKHTGSSLLFSMFLRDFPHSHVCPHKFAVDLHIFFPIRLPCTTLMFSPDLSHVCFRLFSTWFNAQCTKWWGLSFVTKICTIN